jgi:hypothetical protein
MGTIYMDCYASHGQPHVLTKGEKKNIKCEVSQWSDANHGQGNKYLVSKILNMNSTSRIPFSFVWFDDEIWSSFGGCKVSWCWRSWNRSHKSIEVYECETSHAICQCQLQLRLRMACEFGLQIRLSVPISSFF